MSDDGNRRDKEMETEGGNIPGVDELPQGEPSPSRGATSPSTEEPRPGPSGRGNQKGHRQRWKRGRQKRQEEIFQDTLCSMSWKLAWKWAIEKERKENQRRRGARGAGRRGHRRRGGRRGGGHQGGDEGQRGGHEGQRGGNEGQRGGNEGQRGGSEGRPS